MKGAMALPWVRMIRPPNTASMMRMGTSQNFRLARTNAHSSRTKESIATSELVRHGPGHRTRGPALDPVARSVGVEIQAQEILAEGAEHESHRGDHEVEERGEHEQAHCLVRQQA